MYKRSRIFFGAIIIVLSVVSISRAVALYTADSSTLDPQCAPGDTNCNVAPSASYVPQGVTINTVGGITSGTDLGTSAVTVQSILDKILYPYTAPAISLAISPGAGLREKGNSVSSVALTATTTKRTNAITAVTFKRNGTTITCTGANSVQANGGTQTCTDTTPVTTNTTYTATVSDGTSTTTSNSQAYTFVSPYYYGVGAKGLTPAQVAGLTKVLQGNTATYRAVTSPSNQVYYFAYPQSYNALTSVLDNSNFETISDYTVTTSNSITNGYGDTDTYRIYEFKNLTTQSSFGNTYKQ